MDGLVSPCGDFYGSGVRGLPEDRMILEFAEDGTIRPTGDLTIREFIGAR